MVNTALMPLGVKISRIERIRHSAPYQHKYDLAPDALDGLDRDTRRVLNLVNYTKRSATQYSAERYESAYYSIELKGRSFAGQRAPKARLDAVPFDFDGATVLDIGCNQGGMLFALSDRIRHGVGIDYDPRMVNSANRLKSYRGVANVDFYVFDLEREDLAVIQNFLSAQTVDIVLLLSVCMWISNWREVIDKARDMSTHLLFETNGSPAQQLEQEAFLRRTYGGTTLIRDSSPDDQHQKARRLHLCSR
jgi:SAM-dependent methyltransferase